MFTTIATILAGLGSVFTQTFNRYQERKIAEHSVLIAQEDAKKALAMATVKAELELGREQIKASSPWFKHFTFFMWFSPFVITTLFPTYGAQIFKNWSLMPEWYAQSCVALMFIIWGVQVGKEYIKNIFAGAGEFFRRRQELRINRKIFYDVVKNAGGNLNQAQVDIYEKAINAMLPQDAQK